MGADTTTNFNTLVAESEAVIGGATRRYSGMAPAPELRQAALIGLWDASKLYDPARGASFKTYAAIKMRGAIGDYLRTTRHAARQLVKPEFVDIDDTPIEYVPPRHTDEMLEGVMEDLQQNFAAHQVQTFYMHLHKGLPFSVIGAAMGITESGACFTFNTMKRWVLERVESDGVAAD